MQQTEINLKNKLLINELLKKYTKQEINDYLNKKYEEALIEKARYDFFSFCKLINMNIEKFYHLDLSQDWAKCTIQSFQDLINSKDIHRSIYNLPPRTGKTTLLTVFGSCWILGKSGYPVKIAIINANNDKLDEINIDIKNIINSSVYKKIFNIKDISKQGAVKKIRLNNYSIISFRVSGSAVIGSGYNFLIFDDYLNPNNEHSVARKEQAKMNLSSFMSRKEYNKPTKSIVIEQRVSTDDTTAICKQKWDEGEIKYNHIILPYYFNKELSINGFIFKENTFLDIKFNQQDKKEIIAERGLNIFQTQYQQNPVISVGSFFDRQSIESLQIPIQEIQELRCPYIISVDVASLTQEENDYSAIAIMKFDYEIKKVYVYQVFNIKMEFLQLCKYIISIVNGVKEEGLPYRLIIEKNGSGHAVINYIENQNISVEGLTRGASLRRHNTNNIAKTLKQDMALHLKFLIDSKEIYFPHYKDCNFMYDLSNQLVEFPYGKHDDMVDSLTNAIFYLMEKKYLRS